MENSAASRVKAPVVNGKQSSQAEGKVRFTSQGTHTSLLLGDSETRGQMLELSPPLLGNNSGW